MEVAAVETEVGAEVVAVLAVAETLEVEEEVGAWIIEGATEEAEGASEEKVTILNTTLQQQQCTHHFLFRQSIITQTLISGRLNSILSLCMSVI